MAEWVAVMESLNAMCDGIEQMAKEAEMLKLKVIEIRKRSEEVESIVGECIGLMNSGDRE